MLITKELYAHNGGANFFYRELSDIFFNFFISLKDIYIETICPTVFMKKPCINQQKTIANSETGKEW